MRFAGLVFCCSLALAACADTATEEVATEGDDLTAADAALVAFGAASQRSLYVRLPARPSKELTTAMIDAAKRGVDTRAVLFASDDFDSNWTLQQHLESSGIDVDVRKDKPLEGVLGFSDDAALLRKHYLHAKAIVSDECAYIGSQNFTNGGLRNNRELGEIFDDAALVRTIASTFEDDARGHE